MEEQGEQNKQNTEALEMVKQKISDEQHQGRQVSLEMDIRNGCYKFFLRGAEATLISLQNSPDKLAEDLEARIAAYRNIIFTAGFGEKVESPRTLSLREYIGVLAYPSDEPVDVFIVNKIKGVSRFLRGIRGR